MRLGYVNSQYFIAILGVLYFGLVWFFLGSYQEWKWKQQIQLQVNARNNKSSWDLRLSLVCIFLAGGIGGLGFGVLGFFGGGIGLSGVAYIFYRQRNKKLQKQKLISTPDFIDLLRMALSSGLSLRASWEVAVSFLPSGPLKAELIPTLEKIKLGQPMNQMILDLRDKPQKSQSRVLWSLIHQSSKYGTSMDETLKDLSDSFRQQYWLECERQAQTVNLKLLFPIFLFIFPALFIAVFAPLILQIRETGLFF